MADQPSVFDDQNPQETPAQQETQQPAQEPAPQAPAEPAPTPSSETNVFADRLASIQNERGEPKYRDVETALDALKHSQEYIPQVKQENDTLKSEVERLKAELEQKSNLEETVERLTAKRQEDPSSPTQEGLTQEQITALLEQTLSQREQAQVAQSNLAKVEEAIRTQYGEKAQEVAKQKAQELGISVTKFSELAAESPQMVLSLFDVKPSSPQGNPSSSSVSIPPVRPNGEPELERPEKSLLQGATSKEQAEFFRKIREHTYKRLGVTEE